MKKGILFVTVFSLTVVFSVSSVFAGPPYLGLQGVGGGAFNPFAYLADSGEDDGLRIGDVDAVGKPRFGVWYVSLPDVNVDWTTVGTAVTLLDRLEVSYGYETINQENTSAKHKNNIGAKFLILPENSFDTEFFPAVSVGTIFKHTSNTAAGIDSSGQDYYAVATKLIAQLPAPVVLSSGLLSTKGRATGVFGYGSDREMTWFGNVNIFLPGDLNVGFEYKEGASYSTWKDADYWNLHLIWSPNADLSLILAYVDAGDSGSSSKVGLGEGIVLSAQYAF